MCKLIGVIGLLCLISISCSSHTPEKPEVNTKSETKHDHELKKFQAILPEGSSLDIYYQTDNRRDLAINVANMLRENHKNFISIFGKIPQSSTTVVMIDSDLFYVKTASPNWVHALYHKGRIFIPITKDVPIDYVHLYRSLKHEYSHSVIHALSKGRCPAWIDEGLAQWFEGSSHKSNDYILADWLLTHHPIPLNRLQKGFIALKKERAKVGYEQSLFAVQDLIDTYGIKRFGTFFALLREGKHPKRAFFKTFGLSEKEYEQRLDIKLHRWARSARRR